MLVVADEGYSLIESEEDIIKGGHGYDSNLESMKCIFLGIGIYLFNYILKLNLKC